MLKPAEGPLRRPRTALWQHTRSWSVVFFFLIVGLMFVLVRTNTLCSMFLLVSKTSQPLYFCNNFKQTCKCLVKWKDCDTFGRWTRVCTYLFLNIGIKYFHTERSAWTFCSYCDIAVLLGDISAAILSVFILSVPEGNTFNFNWHTQIGTLVTNSVRSYSWSSLIFLIVSYSVISLRGHPKGLIMYFWFWLLFAKQLHQTCVWHKRFKSVPDTQDTRPV